MAELTPVVATAVRRHVVTLNCMLFVPGKSRRPLLFSGFVIDLKGEWFFITAGHILADLRKGLELGYQFKYWQLGDQTANNQFAAGVPFHFDVDEWLDIYDRHETGMDYAAVHLTYMYRRQLEAGGIQAVPGRTGNDHTSEHDHWVIAGFPAESIEDGETMISARLTIIPLIPTEPPPHSTKRLFHFYAALDERTGSKFQDANGLSGGPILAFKRVGNNLEYAVIGVQSAWYRDSRILIACHFDSFTAGLESAFSRVSGDGSDGPA